VNESTEALPSLRSHERAVLQPWFDLTGLDEQSAEWRSVWAGLVKAELAGEHGLTLWPVAGASQPRTDTVATQTVRLALVVGAHYGTACPEVGPGGAVALVLELLYRDPDVLTVALNCPPKDGVQHILAVLAQRVTGVFADAPSALSSQIDALRANVVAGERPLAGDGEALVNLVLDEAVKDEVFAEHVLLQMNNANPSPLDVVLLPGGQWVVLKVARAGIADTLCPGQ
jgi:hypothetical protein